MRRSNPFPMLSGVWESISPSPGYAHSAASPRSVLLATLLVVAVLGAGQTVSKPQLSAAHRAWLEDEAVYIITATERSVFLKLQTDRERELFIAAFWKQRDPTPGTPENEFKTEHFRRIAYANQQLGREGAVPGWKTDRGRMYILLGEPLEILRYAGKSGIYDCESWFYQG
ncbi:MAG: GWxTD domain-containing protein, partial [Candidatus Aminicenantes bacterium]|nr:GWxTD domain-containing protein [Candidatus Aminicenantes bacterium]